MAGPDPSRYLPADVTARISRLEVEARTVVEGFLSGMHRSPYFGQSIEFAQHREYAPGDDTRRVPWEQVEAADWDRDTDTFRLSEVGTWGEQRPVHTATLADPGRLLELVRERVTASVVLQRHVTVSGRRGLRVIARRAPSGSGGVEWVYEYDEGVDPDDPAVREVARATLEAMRREVGLP